MRVQQLSQMSLVTCLPRQNIMLPTCGVPWPASSTREHAPSSTQYRSPLAMRAWITLPCRAVMMPVKPSRSTGAWQEIKAGGDLGSELVGWQMAFPNFLVQMESRMLMRCSWILLAGREVFAKMSRLCVLFWQKLRAQAMKSPQGISQTDRAAWAALTFLTPQHRKYIWLSTPSIQEIMSQRMAMSLLAVKRASSSAVLRRLRQQPPCMKSRKGESALSRGWYRCSSWMYFWDIRYCKLIIYDYRLFVNSFRLSCYSAIFVMASVWSFTAFLSPSMAAVRMLLFLVNQSFI